MPINGRLLTKDYPALIDELQNDQLGYAQLDISAQATLMNFGKWDEWTGRKAVEHSQQTNEDGVQSQH